jgi:putative endonuclease
MEKGKFGEILAKNFLKKNGYSILFENYRTRFGEIDLIVEKNNTIIFVEVKYRTNKNFGRAEESINKSKIKKIRNSAVQFLKNYKKDYKKFRIDIIAINNFELLEINHYKNIEL